jgi:GntR family transcriptional regulator
MNFENGKAIYLQIADIICENILLDKWTDNFRIPSVRDFAISLEVNPNTVNRTYTFLQEKNIIHNQRGIGYFVSDNSKEKVLNVMKEEFLKNETPNFIKKMKLLNIDLNDLKKIFDTVSLGD